MYCVSAAAITELSTPPICCARVCIWVALVEASAPWVASWIAVSIAVDADESCPLAVVSLPWITWARFTSLFAADNCAFRTTEVPYATGSSDGLFTRLPVPSWVSVCWSAFSTESSE